MRTWVRTTIILLLCGVPCFGGTLPCGSAPCNTGVQTISAATWGGPSDRYYEADFPAGINPAKPYTLIVWLNGAETNFAYNNPPIELPSLLHSFCSEQQNPCAVAWPVSECLDSTSSTGGSPPLPECTSSTATADAQWVYSAQYLNSYIATDPQDVAFIHYFIGTLASSWGATDPTQIILAGGSTGGMEVHRFLRSSDAGDVAGGAAFAGPIYAQTGTSTPSAPTIASNLFLEQGINDQVLPVCSGTTTFIVWLGMPLMSNLATLDTTFNFWQGATVMGCGTPTPNTNACTAGALSAGFSQKVAQCGSKMLETIVTPNRNHSFVQWGDLCLMWNFYFPNRPCTQNAPATQGIL